MRMGLFAVAALLIAPLSTFAADPPIVFQTQSPGKILSDVRSIAKMIAGEKAAGAINDALKEKLGDKGFDGLAIDKPILGYAILAGKLEDSVLVIAVPVTGEKEFLALIERIGGEKPKADANGLYEFPTKDEGVKALMRFDTQHAYIAIGKDPTSALNPKNLVAPTKLYDPSEKALASVKVYFDRLPKEIRDQLGAGLKELKTKLDELRLPPEASESARKAVDELIKLGSRYSDMLQDAESAGARLILDANTGEAAVEVGLTGKPGSALAKVIAERKPSTNKFAGLVTPDTVVGLKLQLPLFAKEIQNAAVIGLEAGQKQLNEMAPPAFKGLIDETFKGLVRTVNDGEFDVALSLRGPDKNGLYTVVGAVAFEDPSGVEKELRVLYKNELDPKFKAFFNLDIAQVGKTNIHQAKIGPLLPPEIQKVFGDEASFTFAFAPKGIFVAFGPDAVNVLKTALEVKKAPSPAFEISLNPSRLAKLIAAAGKEVPAGFGSQDKLIPVVVLTLDGGKELRLRLGTNLKWLEGLGTSLLDAGVGGDAKPPASVKVKD
ncbi:MAG: hypothetical protein K8U57_12095 [Planctomycetes bacterium]|nr:hypothetical protein [Planctomycetota bacterium]